MAGKGWTAQVAAAAGVAAGTGAAQLGLGYGLGVVTWPVTPTPDDSIWLGSLGWATWIAAGATVFGAVIAARLPGGPAPRPAGPWRWALAASAAVGALLTVALIALPARSAVRSDTFSPQTIAAGYALIGVLLGLVIAYWAVVSRPVAANLVATAAWLWTLAAAAIVVELAMHRSSATYLTSWQFAELGDRVRGGTISWPSAVLTLLAAFLIGVIGAWPAARSGNLGLGAASSGAVGPLLVAAAFLVLAPQLTGALGQLESAYLIAPYAVLTGLAGSASTVAAMQEAARRRAERTAVARRTATGRAAVPQHRGGDPDRERGEQRQAGFGQVLQRHGGFAQVLPRARRPDVAATPETHGPGTGGTRPADPSPRTKGIEGASAARSGTGNRSVDAKPAAGGMAAWWRRLSRKSSSGTRTAARTSGADAPAVDIGTIKPGTIKPGTIKPGTIKPGTPKAGTMKAGKSDAAAADTPRPAPADQARPRPAETPRPTDTTPRDPADRPRHNRTNPRATDTPPPDPADRSRQSAADTARSVPAGAHVAAPAEAEEAKPRRTASTRRPASGRGTGPADADPPAPRSSVKAPPASPPIAQINPPQAGDTAEPARPAATRPRRAAPGRATKRTPPDPDSQD